MNDIQNIQSMIYEVRGQRVMLDFDLAEMYGVETRRLNEQVKRNIERFPEDFMFQLTKGELEILRSQIATSNSSDNQKDTNWTSQIATSNFAKMGLRKTPYAFTENGVAMLSSVLRSPLAIQVNIGIMRAFTAFRHLAASLPKSDVTADVAQLRKDFEDLKLDIEDILHDQNDINEETRAQLDAISTALSELQSTPHSPIVPSWVLASQVIRNNSFTLNKLQCLGTLYIHDAFLRLCDETALISSQILRQNMKIITNRQTNLQNNAYFATFLPKNAQNHTLYRFKKVIWLFSYLVIFCFRAVRTILY